MAISISYSYKINAKFVLNGKEETILEEGINGVVTNYDYDKNNIPIIFMNVNLETSLYNKMVLNESKGGTITLTIMKAKNGTNNPVYTNYIKDSFTYMMPTNPDYDTSIEKAAGTDDKVGASYKSGTISLIQISTTNNNKKMINGIIKNSNMASIIHKYTSHMKMIMEPLHTDKNFDFLIIPPLDSIAKLLKYLNQQSTFYRGGYRYFVDFDKTYLLSAEGNPVAAKDGSYSTVIINVNDPTSEAATQTGVITDAKSKSYIINVNANNTITDIKKAEDKIFNKLLGVDSFGKTKELNLDIPKTKDSSDKLKLERVPSDNMEYLSYLKTNIENSTIILSITKTEVDSTLITPNKEYIVNNYSSLSEYDGRYVLSYKKEVFTASNESMFIFGLRKIKNR